MVDDADRLQAEALINELHRQADDISAKLEAADDRNRRVHLAGMRRRDVTAGDLRRQLYEAHRLIENLHRRYPRSSLVKDRSKAG